jgi:radical SAM protein (TIGR01212 family)
MSTSNKHYNAYSDYIRKKYGERIQKISVHAGFTCPNRDGTLGNSGCIYCNNNSFIPGYIDPADSISEQIKKGIAFLQNRYKVKKFFVYFQPFSNTYASPEILEKYFEEALSFKEVIGLTIGTRPDCINEEKIKLLSRLSKSYDITIEYGLESIFDETLEKINRGHDFKCYLDALEMTAGKGIHICTHIIIGFPWENKDLWLKEADVLSGLATDSLKIHQLHIVKDTLLGHQYMKKPFDLLTFTQYLDIIVLFLERLNPRIVIQRLFGEAPPDILIAPKWNKRNAEILHSISKEFERRNSWQGKYFGQDRQD